MQKIWFYSICMGLLLTRPVHAESVWKCTLKTDEISSKSGEGTLEVHTHIIAANFDEYGQTGTRYLILKNTDAELVGASYGEAGSRPRKQLSAMMLDKHSGELEIVSVLFGTKYQEAWNATCTKI